jgi:hypothetical protein
MEERRGEERRGEERRGEERRGEERKGEERRGKERKGEERRGEEWDSRVSRMISSREDSDSQYHCTHGSRREGRKERRKEGRRKGLSHLISVKWNKKHRQLPNMILNLTYHVSKQQSMHSDRQVHTENAFLIVEHIVIVKRGKRKQKTTES